MRPLHSLRAAIRTSIPTIIIPCDDLTVQHMHRLYEIEAESANEASKTICEVIRFSLGDPAGYRIPASRDKFIAMVHEEGIHTPETRTVASQKEVERWLSEHGLPAVLKADGTSGGEGVRIAHTPAEATAAYRTLHAPVSGFIVAKRACLDRDRNAVLPWLWQHKRSVSIQSFISGPDANIAVAAWEGRMLANICVEVLETWRPKGPATLVRRIENNEMVQAAEKILRRLHFSGLCGFDFMIDKATGHACLIEMNPRATQTCSLPLGPGHDPVAAICSIIMGEQRISTPLDMQGDKIALFPLAWQGDTSRDTFQSAYHDIPWDEPELVKLGMQQIRNRPHEKWIRWLTKMGLYSG